MPESPLWLADKGRMEEARAALKRVRVNTSDEAIDTEFQAIALGVQTEKAQGSYADLFKSTNRKSADAALRPSLLQSSATYNDRVRGECLRPAHRAIFRFQLRSRFLQVHRGRQSFRSYRLNFRSHDRRGLHQHVFARPHWQAKHPHHWVAATRYMCVCHWVDGPAGEHPSRSRDHCRLQHAFWFLIRPWMGPSSLDPHRRNPGTEAPRQSGSDGWGNRNLFQVRTRTAHRVSI